VAHTAHAPPATHETHGHPVRARTTGTARLSAESSARRGSETELTIDTSRIKVFDETGTSLTA
jgi:hypothetical protein